MVFSVSSLLFIVSLYFLVASSCMSFISSKILLFLIFHISHVVSVTISMYLSFSHSGASFSFSLSFVTPSPLSILMLGFIHWKFCYFSSTFPLLLAIYLHFCLICILLVYGLLFLFFHICMSLYLPNLGFF